MTRFERKAQSQPKHGPPTSSGSSKAGAAPPKQRPGWKGPSYIKKAPKKASSTSQEAPAGKVVEQLVPIKLQQRVLDIFRTTFPAAEDIESFKPTLKQIKDALVQKNFEQAYGIENNLELYACRWGPSRALAYLNLLAGICSEWKEEISIKQLVEADGKDQVNVVCFGGGAAEIMAFTGLLRHLRPDTAGKPVGDDDASNSAKQPCEDVVDGHGLGSAIYRSDESHDNTLMHIHIVDKADWSSVIAKLREHLTTPPTLSRYASAAARAANASFIDPQALGTNFSQVDILEATFQQSECMIVPRPKDLPASMNILNLNSKDRDLANLAEPALFSLFFTMSELLIKSQSQAVMFLSCLTDVAPKGSLLLVVDEPGSSVGVQVERGSEKIELPISALLDRRLLKMEQKDGQETQAEWEKLVSEDGIWHKLEKGLRYVPGCLENMRLQMHLYRRK